MAENHLHSISRSVPVSPDQQPNRSNDDSIMATLQNTSCQVYRLQLELTVKADECGISESAAHYLREIQSASEHLLAAMAAYEATLHVSPTTTAHKSPVRRAEISLGKPVACPKLSEHQEKLLAHFEAEFGS